MKTIKRSKLLSEQLTSLLRCLSVWGAPVSETLMSHIKDTREELEKARTEEREEFLRDAIELHPFIHN